MQNSDKCICSGLVLTTRKDRRKIRYLFLAWFLACVLSLTACSYTTNFVVVNASGQTIAVRYKIKKPPDPVPLSQMLPVVPGTKPISQLHEQIAWRELSPSEYTLDLEKRTVVVSLKPGEALRVEHRNLLDGPDDAHRAENFSIEEMNIVGANGEIDLKGEQARKSFVPESKTVYTLTYR